MKLQTGNLLIAPPNMPDPRFHDSVILLVQHEHTGSVGFALNKPPDYVVNDILEEIEVPGNLPFPLYWGGPVKSSAIWMLHNTEWTMDNTVPVNDTWAMTSNRAMFTHMCDGDLPNCFRFLHGIATWGPGQLEGELRGDYPWDHSSSWLVTEDPGPEFLFECPEEHLWEQATELVKDQFVNDWL